MKEDGIYTYRESYKESEYFWYIDYRLYETGRQEYAGNNCIFAAGLVDNHPVDTHYLLMEKDGQEATVILFRPDEMAAIAWLCSGALWTTLIGERTDGSEKEHESFRQRRR